MPTREVLKFSMAHAEARDAVRTPLDWTGIEQSLAILALQSLRIASQAADRDIYLRRPDLGRKLDAVSHAKLADAVLRRPAELLLIIADGLSSTAVIANAVPAIAALLPHLHRNGWQPGPVLLASQARVALSDEAGGIFKARAVLMLIGERPGLSSPDSLGAYLTWDPRPGRKDGERNCLSNIRSGGLGADEAAFKMEWLLREAFRRRLSGVQLKDESQYQLTSTDRHSAPQSVANDNKIPHIS